MERKSNRSYRNNRGRGRRGRSNRSQKRGNLYNTLENTKGPKNLQNNFPFPQSKVYKLTTNTNFVVLDTTESFKVVDINLGNIWNPIQGVTTVFPTGIKTLKQIYTQSLVLKVTVKFVVSNNETGLPTCFGIIFRDTQPSRILTYEDARSALELGFTSGPQMVAEIQGQPIYRSPIYTIECGKIVGNPLQYVGSRTYLQDLVPSSPIAPVETTWCGFIGYTPFGTNLTNGLIVQFILTQHVRLYGILNIVPGPKPPQIEDKEKEIEELKLKIQELQLTVEKLLLQSEDESSDDVEEDKDNDTKNKSS